VHTIVDAVPPSIWESTDTERLVSGLPKATVSPTYGESVQAALL
jgi:hypothetical protein